jgi:hypothetical protein
MADDLAWFRASWVAGRRNDMVVDMVRYTSNLMGIEQKISKQTPGDLTLDRRQIVVE